MKIDNLLWTEIQEIRIAVENYKEERWEALAKIISKKTSFNDIKAYRKEYDMNRNKFTIEGRCNKILELIQKQDLAIQKDINSQERESNE